MNNDGIMYIMEPDKATIGEIEDDEENRSDEDDEESYPTNSLIN